ncbi:MAG: peptidylprolyl isomerase [Luteimonas sp.]
MKNLLLSLLAALLLSGTAHAQQVQPLDEIAAVVDEDVILRSELDRAVANILSQYADQQAQLPPLPILQRQVLERLILMRLQTERAAGTGIRVDDGEIDSMVAAIAQQNGMTVDQLRGQIEADGMSFGDFRSSLREELMTQRLRQRFAQSRIVVSEGEVDAAMNSRAGGNQYRLAHILVALPDGATPEQISLAEEKIEGIKSLIDRNDMEFAAAAVRYSDSPNALEGGDLGWRRTDEIPAAFSTAVSSMQPGGVFGPMRGPSGFQLLKLVDVRDASAPGGAVTQYHARHILIRSGEDAAEDAAARERAEALHARIVAGEDFAEVATEESDDASSSASGGDLGWFTVDQFGAEFGGQVAPLDDGGVSEPFRTQAGWHVVQRIESRQAQVDDEVQRNAVRESIGQRKLEDEWDRFLREMRSEAFVDIRVGAEAGNDG